MFTFDASARCPEYYRAVLRSVGLATHPPLVFSTEFDGDGLADREGALAHGGSCSCSCSRCLGLCERDRDRHQAREARRARAATAFIRPQQNVFVRAFTVPRTAGLTFARFRAIVAQLAEAGDRAAPCPRAWRKRFRDDVREKNAALVTAGRRGGVHMTRMLEEVCRWDAFPPCLASVLLREARWLTHEGDCFVFVGEEQEKEQEQEEERGRAQASQSRLRLLPQSQPQAPRFWLVSAEWG